MLSHKGDMNPNKRRRTYCINTECSKHENCARFTESPRMDGDSRRFEENWGGISCSKYRPLSTVRESSNGNSVEQPIAFYSSSPQDMELREHLIRHIGENLDKVFAGDAAWAERTHSYEKVSARIVDLLMPIISSKRSNRPNTYR
jgi:hypothetical protein